MKQRTLTDDVDHEGSEDDDPPPATIRGRGLKTRIQFILCDVLMAGATCAPLGRGSVRHLSALQPVADTRAPLSIIDAATRTPASARTD
jgi:hypothetical protein